MENCNCPKICDFSLGPFSCYHSQAECDHQLFSLSICWKL